MIDTLHAEEYSPLLEKVRSVSSEIVIQTDKIRKGIIRWKAIPNLIRVEVDIWRAYRQIVQIDTKLSIAIEMHTKCSKESPCKDGINSIMLELKKMISDSTENQQSLIELVKKAGLPRFIISIQERILGKYGDLLENYMFVGDSEANELINELAELESHDAR